MCMRRKITVVIPRDIKGNETLKLFPLPLLVFPLPLFVVPLPLIVKLYLCQNNRAKKYSFALRVRDRPLILQNSPQLECWRITTFRYSIHTKESRKKFFLVARLLRPYPPHSSLEAKGNSLNRASKISSFFLVVRPLPPKVHVSSIILLDIIQKQIQNISPAFLHVSVFANLTLTLKKILQQTYNETNSIKHI